MREIHDHADAVIEGDPRVLFEPITDIERLPEWNGAIEQVIDRQAALTTGATWTVEMHPARPVRWKSVSTLQELDAEGLRFSYCTVNADGSRCSVPARRRMLLEPALDLCLADDLAHVHTDEDRRCFRHLAKRVEGRFCQPGVFLGIEQPEGMLD